MSTAIKTGKYIAHPFIAPDESYLMWDAEKENEDTPDGKYLFFWRGDVAHREDGSQYIKGNPYWVDA